MTMYKQTKMHLVLLFMFLAACQSQPSNRWGETLHLPSHMQPTDPNKLKMERKLLMQNVKVIQEGQYVLISIPSLLLFHSHNPQISVDSYGLLNDVICYIKMFRKVSVEVNSHDFAPDKKHRVYALTLARASHIADYMISQEIDARMVFTHGMANDKPIYNNETNSNEFGNSRIEIMFKDEIV